MQETTFVHIIRQPALLATHSFEDVSSWVERYPHIAILRVMLAFKAEQSHHDQAASYLEQAACHVPDRRRLKRLMADWRTQMEVAVLQEEKTLVDKAPDAADEIMATLAAMQEQKMSQSVEGGLVEEAEGEIAVNYEVAEVSQAAFSSEVVPELQDVAEVLEVTENVVEELTEAELLNSEEQTPMIAEAEQEVAYAPDTGPNDLLVDAVEEPSEEEAKVEVFEIEISSELEQELKEEETLVAEEAKEASPLFTEKIEVEQSEVITAEDDEDFLKMIGKWVAEPQFFEPAEDQWALEAPGQSLPEIALEEELDAGFVSTDIAWLMPYVAEFDLPLPAMIVAHKADKEAFTELVKHSEISVEVLSPAKEAEPLTVLSEREVSDEEISVLMPVASDLKEEQPEIKEDAQAPAFSSTHSFDEWLQILSKQKEAGGEEPAFEMPQPDYIGAAEEDDRDRPEVKELVDVPESDVKRWAQESVTMQKDMASETLAKIYLQQGKVALAIQIYKKLMERFPEKSTYFAAQIKSIKQE